MKQNTGGGRENELSMGRHDTDRNYIRGIYRADAGGDGRCTVFLKGGSDAVHHDGGSHVVMVGSHGDRKQSGDDPGNFKEDPAADPVFIPWYP